MQRVVRNMAGDELRGILGEHFKVAGKLNRPRTVELLARSYKVRPEKALPWAAALEMFHNGSLIHDDIQDGDVVRRGEPALWSLVGTGRGMNAGTFLMINAQVCLRDEALEKDEILDLSELLARIASEALEGQCLEAKLNRLENLRQLRGLYMHVARLKTGALFAGLAQGIAVLAKLSVAESVRLRELFGELGLLFQLQDDILDLYGDKQKGMQGNDVMEGKVSFLILKHLELYHYNLEGMRKLLSRGRGNIDRGDILVLKEQLVRDGTLDMALEELSSRLASLMGGELFTKRPRVRSTVESLAGEIVTPLMHLEGMQKFFGQALSNMLVGQGMGRQI